PGPYTYTYRIRIPADYSSDIIRVELFDPDSINNALTAATVTHTQIAVAQGHPITETINCYAFVDQRDTCILHTGEITLTNATLDAVNPIWLVRVDENRGHGSNDGDGHCYEPRDYTPAYNTQTAYQLYYQANNGGGPQRVNLAAYTGQVNDGARDTGDHDTDLRWVSPGAPTSYDQPIAVPTDCGSPNGGDFDLAACPGGTLPGTGNGFEVSLAQDLTNIVVDPDSGARYLYLDVRTISGASGNGFAIWAGPPDYAAAIASDVNARNLQIVNNPGAHQSAGI
ncbi:MAG: hypothetical protein GY803_23425, partial [Chloroflexi bacterium]|nr:hypothetical protein [Chloroflexota bacterium]